MIIINRKMLTKLILQLLVLVSVILLQVPTSSAGECCQAHWDTFNRYHVQRWCPVFCCGSPATGLRCCSDFGSRASQYVTDDFCAAWFIASHNLWIPILVGILILAIIISSCICCVRCCCMV